MRTNEEKLELFADILEPAARILADKKIKEMVDSKAPAILAVKHAIKSHKAEIIEILALFEGVAPEAYQINAPALVLKLLAIMNDPDFKAMSDGLFTSPLQSAAVESVGYATANTAGVGI